MTRHKRTGRSAGRTHIVAPSVMPCGKVGYLTRADARAGAAQIGRKQGVRLTVYRCDDERCEGLPWHLTGGARWAR